MHRDILTHCAFARGRTLHAATGEPILGRLEVRAEEGHVQAKIFEDGRFFLFGPIDVLFPELAVNDYQLHVTVRAYSRQFVAGIAERTLTPTVLRGSTFDPAAPMVPTPLVDLGDIRLPSDLVTIGGRVTEAANPGTAILGATVQILSAMGPLPPQTTNGQGEYRFSGLALLGPSRIQCSAPTFTAVTRQMRLDLEASANTENFQLAP